MDDQNGFGVAEFKPTENELDYHNRVAKALQTTDNSLYASNFGASVGRYYDYALSSAGTSYGKAKVGEVGLNYDNAKVGEVGGTSGTKFSVTSGANSNLHFGTNVNLNSETKINLVSNENANSVSGLNFYTQSNAEFSNLDKEKGANRVYVYNNKVVGIDKNLNDNKVVDLTKQEMIGSKYELSYSYGWFGIDMDTNAVINEKPDTTNYKNEFDLTDKEDFETLLTRTNMNYININQNTDIVFINGMDNKFEDALESANLFQRDFPNAQVGFINDESQGLLSDVAKWLYKDGTTRDVLNAYQIRQLPNGTLITTHSAANEKIRKANEINAILGVKTPFNHISVGSPTSATILKKSDESVGANFLGQINRPYDPVAHPLLNENSNYLGGSFKSNLDNHHSYIDNYHPSVKVILDNTDRLDMKDTLNLIKGK